LYQKNTGLSNGLNPGSARAAAEENHQRRNGRTETHSDADQLYNVNRVKRFKAGLAGDVEKTAESEEQENEKKIELASIAHGASSA
jgi:hypothetical protein